MEKLLKLRNTPFGAFHCQPTKDLFSPKHNHLQAINSSVLTGYFDTTLVRSYMILAHYKKS